MGGNTPALLRTYGAGVFAALLGSKLLHVDAELSRPGGAGHALLFRYVLHPTPPLPLSSPLFPSRASRHVAI